MDSYWQLAVGQCDPDSNGHLQANQDIRCSSCNGALSRRNAGKVKRHSYYSQDLSGHRGWGNYML